jgi:hypothetical protein
MASEINGNGILVRVPPTPVLLHFSPSFLCYPFDNSLLLQRQVESVAMALLFDVELQLMSPFSPSFSLSVMLWLLINSGIPFDNSLLFARAQRLLFASEVTMRPFVFLRSGCRN